jgi:hypothetical protein
VATPAQIDKHHVDIGVTHQKPGRFARHGCTPDFGEVIQPLQSPIQVGLQRCVVTY